ncbi:hypothetical protein PGT21_003520 [Puccinia graminis f. sp. tritici]|uniref:Uncharacterized protein n=1 Tax=Puccinia graminis f. sp. tritici TaxID=56615 RepID=A0A5B0PQZ9_PUCGR|nr:hypothetical protein PGT21_003520 [Puccinia graminis f. sp. tritici]
MFAKRSFLFVRSASIHQSIITSAIKTRVGKTTKRRFQLVHGDKRRYDSAWSSSYWTMWPTVPGDPTGQLRIISLVHSLGVVPG